MSSDGFKKDYITINAKSFKVIASFPFRGTALDIPTKFLVVGSRSGTSGTVTARIYDVTNSNVIATLSWTFSSKQIYSTTLFTNLPAGESLFEIQVKRSNSSAGKARIHSVGVV